MIKVFILVSSVTFSFSCDSLSRFDLKISNVQDPSVSFYLKDDWREIEVLNWQSEDKEKIYRSQGVVSIPMKIRIFSPNLKEELIYDGKTDSFRGVNSKKSYKIHRNVFFSPLDIKAEDTFVVFDGNWEEEK